MLGVHSYMAAAPYTLIQYVIYLLGRNGQNRG